MRVLVFCLLLGAAPRITIPAGEFRQGSLRAPDEQPMRSVALSAYSIDRTEVSVKAFEEFVQSGYDERPHWSAQGWAWHQAHPHGAEPQTRRAGRPEDHPVVAVTWYEADAYCRWRGGRLPTEAQWERASCGGGPGPYPWGTAVDRSVRWSAHGHHNGPIKVDTAPVTQDAARGPDDLQHMIGNVWEWTADWYTQDAYTTEPTPDPLGPKAGTWRVLRGGSYLNLPSYCSCTHREPAAPDQPRMTTGFRCAYPSP